MSDNKDINELFNIVPDDEEATPVVTEEKQEKKNKKTLYIILSAAALVVLIFVGIAVFGLCDMNGAFNGSEKQFEIKEGTPASVVAEILEDEDVIESSLFFRVYCRMKGYDSSFKYGVYKIGAKSSYEEIAKKLMTEGAVAESVSVTIPEGTSIYDYTKDVNGNDVTIPGIATLLSRAGVCTKEDFFEALHGAVTNDEFFSSVNKEDTYVALEGYLFPDTYDFYFYDSKECAALAVNKMLECTKAVFSEDMLKKAQEKNMSINEVLTLASIVQMESGLDTKSMPKVASVFYNRLKNGGTLGSSPTCYYGNAFKDDDGRYDTYKIKGLPPGPLCAPGKDAINAVLYPEENFDEYYYFVTDKNGNFYFHKTYGEQQNTIDRLKRENNWIYEYLD